MSETEERKKPVDREILGSVYLKRRQHAIYPTALRTLCGLECKPAGETMLLIPDCRECLETSKRMWAIDHSMPKVWVDELKERHVWTTL